MPEFAVAVVHVTPKDETNEMSNLVQVYEDIVGKWKNPNAIIMGDFNAACR